MNPYPNIPPNGYQIIYADPAWAFDNAVTRAAASDHYQVLTIDEIKRLPVGEIAAKDSTLFLWSPGSILPAALSVLEAWGFKYKTIAWAWIKTYKNGKTVNGMGNATRQCCEFVLRGTRGRPRTISHKVSQEIETEVDEVEVIRSIRGEHSAKPPIIRDRIVELLGDLPRVELFARDNVISWASIGNEIDGKDIKIALENIIPWIDF